MAELGKVFLVLVIRPTDHVEEEIRFCHIPPVPARSRAAAYNSSSSLQDRVACGKATTTSINKNEGEHPVNGC